MAVELISLCVINSSRAEVARASCRVRRFPSALRSCFLSSLMEDTRFSKGQFPLC